MDIDAFRQATRGSSYRHGRRCRMHLALELATDEQRAAIQAAVDDPMVSYDGIAIVVNAVIVEPAGGLLVDRNNVRHWARGACRCEEP